MFYVYVLLSEKDSNLYIGQTNNLEKRLQKHNAGLVKSTCSRRPFKIIHVEKCNTRTEAMLKERSYKTASGKRKLKKFLNI